MTETSRDLTVKFLQRSELLSALGQKDLQFLATKCKWKKFPAGKLIFAPGSAAIQFFILKSGEVDIFQTTDEGEKHMLAKYVAGDSFGEFDFITGALHKVEGRAAKETLLLTFPSITNTLDTIANERPDIAASLYQSSLILLSKRLKSIHNLIAENTTWVKALQEQIYIDQLTGLYTKAYLDSEIPKMLNQPTALIIIKPDKFKELNEAYGHQAGDAIMARLGAALLELTENRPGWAIRLKSNEMAVVLLRFERERALDIAQILAQTVTNISPVWKPVDGKTASGEINWLSASIAVGMYIEQGQNWNRLYETTYKLMQRAWQEGGNRIYSL